MKRRIIDKIIPIEKEPSLGVAVAVANDGTIWRQILVSPDGDTKWQQITGPPAGAQDGNA